MQLMSQAEYARHRGVSKPAVSNWKAKKLLVLAEDPRDGRIKVDVERTDAKLNAKIDPMRGRPSTGRAAADGSSELVLGSSPAPHASATPAGVPDLNTERTAELVERRIGAALKNAQMAGELVPAIEAERRLAEAGRAARERIQAWFRGMAERFAAEKDQRTIMALGEDGIDEVFKQLAAGAERGDFAADDDPGLTAEETEEMLAAASAGE